MFFKALGLAWPFIKEMMLGDKTLVQALRSNKLRLVFMAVGIASMGLNYLTLPKLYSVSLEYKNLQKTYKELKAKDSCGLIKPAPVPPPVVNDEPHKPPVVIKNKKQPKRNSVNPNDTDEIKNAFKKMHDKENTSNH